LIWQSHSEVCPFECVFRPLTDLVVTSLTVSTLRVQQIRQRSGHEWFEYVKHSNCYYRLKEDGSIESSPENELALIWADYKGLKENGRRVEAQTVLGKLIVAGLRVHERFHLPLRVRPLLPYILSSTLLTYLARLDASSWLWSCIGRVCRWNRSFLGIRQLGPSRRPVHGRGARLHCRPTQYQSPYMLLSRDQPL